MQHFTHFTDFDSCVRYLTTELHKSAPNLLKDSASFRKSQSILAALDNPQDMTPTIHIAATSGKGSMGYGIDAILRRHGLHTTLMVSPHAYDIRERIQHDGNLISERIFVALTNEFFERVHTHQITPTYFEALMSMGFMAATKQHGDYVITETGLGGLWDTSNTITRPDKIAVIGSIGLDHTHILGDSLEEIAAQKAGIMTPNGIAIVLRQSKTVNAVFESIAQERNTTIHWVKPASSSYETNWQMAKTTATILAHRDEWEYDAEKADEAIRKLRIPGRFEIRNLNGQTVVLDAAHNRQKAEALTEWIKKTFPGQKFTTIMAISEGKDAAAILAALDSVSDNYIITQFLTDQQDLPVSALSIDSLANIVSRHSKSKIIQRYTNATDALHEAFEHASNPILITGSFYLVGELGNLLDDRRDVTSKIFE